MWNQYVNEKLRQFETERASIQMAVIERTRSAKTPAPKAPRPPVFGPVIRIAGRTLRRAGEGLESWASPGPERDRLPRWRLDEPPS